MKKEVKIPTEKLRKWRLILGKHADPEEEISLEEKEGEGEEESRTGEEGEVGEEEKNRRKSLPRKK